MTHRNHSDGGETSVSYTSDPKLDALLLANKVHVMVYQGDITQETAQAIVNPSIEYLNHCGGAALAIVKSGGKSIQKQCDKTIKKRERLEPGDVVTTSAGKLPCKIIIHAVGPRWSNHTEEESRQLLRLTCQNSLRAAVKKKAKHIVIPAISAEKFGMPTEVCAEELFNAVQEFCSEEKKLRKLKEIRFVNIDAPTVQVFKQELEKRRGVELGEMNEDWKINSAITSSNKAEADKVTQKDKQLKNNVESASQPKATYKEKPSQATYLDYPLETLV